jgi:hypothetical protein
MVYKTCSVSNINVLVGKDRDSLIERVMQHLESIGKGIEMKEKKFKELVDKVSVKEKMRQKQKELEMKKRLTQQSSKTKKKNALDAFDDHEEFAAQEDVNEI